MTENTTGWTVVPRIVPADETVSLRLWPLDRRRLDRAAYRITCYPAEDWGIAGDANYPVHQVAPVDGELRFTQHFAGEQEHTLVVEALDGARGEPVADLRLYSLAPDLYHRRPYKGDLHLHSERSDGREPPAYVAAACRRIGLDFMAVTDHRLYAPSIEAQEAFADVGHDLLICRGEEVHPPGNPTHLINFGASTSINARFTEDTYLREVGEIIAGLGELPPGVDAYHYASCVWCFERIREAGGLGIFCHPYWYTRHRYEPSGALTSLLLQRQPYDAYELIGGYYRHEAESNKLQVARYHDERAAGRQLAIVGVSDAHGCDGGELFGWYYTLVFAPAYDQASLIEGIKSRYAVAIEHLPGEAPRSHGPFRLVKYAQFLLRETLAGHDRLARIEGEWMHRHLQGDSEAPGRLAQLAGQCRAYWDVAWGIG